MNAFWYNIVRIIQTSEYMGMVYVVFYINLA